MRNSIQDPTVLRPRIEGLIDRAMDQAAEDDRAEPRFPLFQPVTLRRGSQLLSAFSRDISDTGIGLLHDMPIGGEYTISVHDISGCEYELTGHVLWCRPCGQGWYISGVQFCRIEAA